MSTSSFPTREFFDGFPRFQVSLVLMSDAIALTLIAICKCYNTFLRLQNSSFNLDDSRSFLAFHNFGESNLTCLTISSTWQCLSVKLIFHHDVSKTVIRYQVRVEQVQGLNCPIGCSVPIEIFVNIERRCQLHHAIMARHGLQHKG